MLEIRGIWQCHMSRWDRYVLRPWIWMEMSRSGTVPHIGPYTRLPAPLEHTSSTPWMAKKGSHKWGPPNGDEPKEGERILEYEVGEWDPLTNAFKSHARNV